MGMEADYNWDQRNNPCFEETELTVYEEWVELLNEITGLCWCNLCQSQGWGGYKQKEQGE